MHVCHKYPIAYDLTDLSRKFWYMTSKYIYWNL
jgi:hypothetical protein